MTRIDADNLHVRKDKRHKDCDWYDPTDFECTNWKKFTDGDDYANVECFQPIGKVFKNKED